MLKFIDRHFPLVVGMALLSLPIVGTILAACSVPNTPEEKAEAASNYAADLKEDLTVLTPRPGVECYVVRGFSAANPRLMSCVVLPSATFGQ
jgi:hypothetical protein